MSIKLKNVSLAYGDNPVLKEINVEYLPQKIHVLLGPSGGGKSSLLRLLNALMDPNSGEVSYNNLIYSEAHPKEIRKKIGMVFQKPALFDGTVYDNLIWSMKVQKLPIDKAKIENMLSQLDIPIDYLDKPIENLSVGEQQRVCIVRTLLANPDVILFDEPTSALDPQRSKKVLELIQQINTQYQKTIILVSHDVNTAIDIADTVTFLQDGQIIFYGAKDQFINSDNEVIKNFNGGSHGN
ncbi:MAG: ATP-binding cassette domain-containing protein [Bacteroidales bacterium]|nr:ATP-binding cassette domain-containing protein [Bacteroidales bacterium]